MKRRLRVLGPVVAVQAVAAGWAYRDLARRRPDQVRGSKKMWRVLLALNSGNSILYWLFGRR